MKKPKVAAEESCRVKWEGMSDGWRVRLRHAAYHVAREGREESARSSSVAEECQFVCEASARGTLSATRLELLDWLPVFGYLTEG